MRNLDTKHGIAPLIEKSLDAKQQAQAASSGWLTRFWKRADSTVPAPVKANLGDESSFYYDKELKRWVNKHVSCIIVDFLYGLSNDDIRPVGKPPSHHLPLPLRAHKRRRRAGSLVTCRRHRAHRLADRHALQRRILST